MSVEAASSRGGAAAVPGGPALDIAGLWKSFGDLQVLRGIDLTVAEHEVVCLIGSSGCGKSTLLRCVNLLEPIDAGRILVAGEEITAQGVDVNRMRRRIGIVFQDFKLLPNKSVRDNVAFALEVTGTPRSLIKPAVDRVLRVVGLSGQADQRPSELSGGEQQRTAIARALVHDPNLFIADEPTGNLDARTGADILSFLRLSARRWGQTVVMVTHDPVAAGYADRVLFLADGRLVDEMAEPTADRVLDRMRGLDARAAVR